LCDFFIDRFCLKYFTPNSCLSASKEMSFMTWLSCVASFNGGQTFALAHHRQFLNFGCSFQTINFKRGRLLVVPPWPNSRPLSHSIDFESSRASSCIFFFVFGPLPEEFASKGRRGEKGRWQRANSAVLIN